MYQWVGNKFLKHSGSCHLDEIYNGLVIWGISRHSFQGDRQAVASGIAYTRKEGTTHSESLWIFERTYTQFGYIPPTYLPSNLKSCQL